MKNNYEDRMSHAILIIAGTGVKYASLLAGVYSVCKDERDFGPAILAGAVYLVGESLQRLGASGSAHRRFSQLERTLLERISKEE